MRKLDKPATPADWINLLRKQSHLLFHDLPPYSRSQAVDYLGFRHESELSDLVDEALWRKRFWVNAHQVISEAVGLCEIKEPEKIMEYFFLNRTQLDKIHEAIESGSKKYKPAKSRSRKMPEHIEQDFDLLNFRALKLPISSQTNDEAFKNLEPNKRTLRLDAQLDGLLAMSAAAADMDVSKFISILVRQYSDSLIRSAILDTETAEDKQTSLHTYNLIRERYANVAKFKGQEPHPQIGNRFGPDSPKYEPPADGDVVMAPKNADDLLLQLQNAIAGAKPKLRAYDDFVDAVESLRVDVVMNKENVDVHQMWLRLLTLEKELGQANRQASILNKQAKQPTGGKEEVA